MLNTNKQSLTEKFDFLFSANIQNIETNFPSIYSKEDLQKILSTMQQNARNIIEALTEAEQTEVAEQTFTLSEIREAIESLDFDNSDFCTLEVNEWGNECKIEAGICTHEIEDYVQNDIIEFLNNIER